ncbi:MAG: AMP-binding protein [Alphaproteobacteria bacterium]
MNPAVPHELAMSGKSEPRAAIDVMRALLSHDAERPAVISAGRTMTRCQLAARAAEAAAGLQALGFRRGDALALWLPNGVEWLILFFAAARLGVLVVPVSTRYRTFEASHLLRTSGAKGIAIAPGFLDIDFSAMLASLRAELPALEHVIEVAREGGFRNLPRGESEPHGGGEGSDPLCAFSTSGTTGNPKLALHDQASILKHAALIARAFEITPQDAVLCALPLYGVFGFCQAMGALAGGAASVLEPAFTAEAAAGAIEAHKVTHFIGSDAMLESVLRVPGRDLRSWRCGGFADFNGRARQLVDEAEAALGLRLVGLYGSSECFALMAKQCPEAAARERALGGGIPIDRGIAFRIADVASGAALPEGEPGELQLKGYNVMSGYLRNPEATAAAFTGDGWFRTGDLAYAAGSGFVYLARIKDSLRLRGYLVDPTEIEEYLQRHAAVEVAQVVGVDRPGEGEVAVAFVRLGREAVTEPELIAYCRDGIAGYKVPRRIVIVAEFPVVHGPNGSKIQKVLLRERAAALLR